MDPQQKEKMDFAVCRKLCTLREYEKEDTIFTYVSKEIEVDTLSFIQAAWKDKKHVVVPRCVPDTHKMEFYEITSMNDLEKGTFGVLEPIQKKCRLVTDYSHGFCVVPGLCFDTTGFRLGYGKGYYDRFLSEFHGFTVGICYSSCVRWNLPHGYYDRPVEILVTEKFIRKTVRSNGQGG